MFNYDTYYIAFYKNQPLKTEELPNDYKVESENLQTGEIDLAKPLEYEVETFDYSKSRN
tara:strand:+ start:1037 stop:1213 length:177 start_codon:yes stop_codon:yes gene_type:complete